MEFDINKYNIFCYTNENIKFQNAYSENFSYYTILSQLYWIAYGMEK